MSSRPGPLGQRLATEIRAELGRQKRSRRWLAAQIGKPHNTLSRWVSGETILPIDDFADICEALNLNMIEVVATVKYRIDVERGLRADPPKAWERRPPPVLTCAA